MRPNERKLGGMIHEASWTNQSFSEWNQTNPPGLEQLQRAHKARCKHSLSTQSFKTNPHFLKLYANLPGWKPLCNRPQVNFGVLQISSLVNSALQICINRKLAWSWCDLLSEIKERKLWTLNESGVDCILYFLCIVCWIMFLKKDAVVTLPRCSIHRNFRCLKSSVTMALVHQYHKQSQLMIFKGLFVALYRKQTLVSTVIKREHLSNDPVRERLSQCRCTF